MNYLDTIVFKQKKNQAVGIPSVCSANSRVLSAVLNHAQENEKYALVESTCNQVNQFGGYTGMKPTDFVKYVHDLADHIGFPRDHLLIGGDHLGPNVWKEDFAIQAMQKSRQLVHDYVEAGYQKIHIDTSISCRDDKDDHGLPLEIIADRTADFVAVCEATYSKLGHKGNSLRYIIGSEVPHPGGMKQGADPITPTKPEVVDETIRLTKKAFEKHGCASAWEREVAIVVQSGVDFNTDHIIDYHPDLAKGLSKYIEGQEGLVFEAHSTDYQTRKALRCLVRDHFAILKVGPALTFAFREAVYALASIERQLLSSSSGKQASYIVEVLESVMLNNPRYWRGYYPKTDRIKLSRHFSLNDRIRYYWTEPEVQESLDCLMTNLGDIEIPLSLLSQYLPDQFRRIRRGELRNKIDEIIENKIIDVLRDYHYASQEGF